MKIFLVINVYGSVIKACSTLGKAFDFCIENNFKYDFRELMSIIEMDVDGDTWGIHHSFEEIDTYEDD